MRADRDAQPAQLVQRAPGLDAPALGLSVSATDWRRTSRQPSLWWGKTPSESCLSCVSFQALTPSLLWRCTARRVTALPQGSLRSASSRRERASFNGVIGETDTSERCGALWVVSLLRLIQDDQSPGVGVNPTETKSARMFSFTAMRFEWRSASPSPRWRCCSSPAGQRETRCWGHGPTDCAKVTNSPSATIRSTTGSLTSLT